MVSLPRFPVSFSGLTGALMRFGADGWFSICFVTLSFFLGLIRIQVTSLAVLGVLTLPLLGFGAVFLAPALLFSMALSAIERSRARGLLNVDLVAPEPVRGSMWAMYIANPTLWRSLAHTSVSGLWGTIASVFLFAGAGLCLRVLGQVVLAFGRPYPGGPFSGMTAAMDLLVASTCCASLVFFVPLAARIIAWTEVWFAKTLITGDRARELKRLNEKVISLEESRTFAIDSVDLERKRIERDLHDGPQQRLTAIAMDIGIALAKLDKNPEKARETLKRAHTAAKEATTELREVIRGIDPPILTHRGLEAALPALAGRCPIPTTVRVELPERPSSRIESIVHFSISEALTNATKHSGAKKVSVSVSRFEDLLVTEIFDDGTGGASTEGGTGLLGLRKRLAAVDGWLDIDSPPGGPTIMTFHVPWRSAQ